MLVLGLCGSLRRDSFNGRLLRAAASSLPPGDHVEIFPGLAPIPPYDEDASTPAPVEQLRAAIAEADAVLIATPEYNASIPGQLKNALDWASRPFPDNALRDKPVAVVGASTGLFGAVWAQAELRKVLTTIGARVVDEELPVCMAHEAFTEDGSLADTGLRDRLADIVGQLVRSVSETSAAADA
ncbi:MAG: NAD(P)H-dependent oxidoreductase [Kutzneria sp.]|nr:NAD(P)H-dependent oxidoreductase [Kutzneria sp.]MBV9846443.1 NAD(P)H-dependent oxidoreductase [Kutzneria sp.]